tara:strand:+ start:1224 stop:1814 length:591 start_codon:yes stop_codon:yes gene_type:complete
MSIALPLTIFFAGLFLIVGKEEPASSIIGQLEKARTSCIEHISKLPKGTMIVFDFDDTLFYPRKVVGYTHSGARDFAFGNRKALPLYQPIQQICDVLKYAVACGMYICLITARPDTASTKHIVLANFKHQKMQLHEFHANSNYPELNNFKAALRKNMIKFRPIGLTVGDAWTDVNESNYAWVKLPTQKEPFMYTNL